MTRALLKASRLSELIQKIYPRQLAGSWDNTGLLLESPYTRKGSSGIDKTRILLCIDLTTSVCEEALSLVNCAHIIAYHPIIFSGIKSITMANSQQRSLLRLAEAGISVYCPHTSVDAIRNGVNDHLVNAFVLPGHSKIDSTAVKLCTVKIPGFEEAGFGRFFKLSRNSMDFTLKACVVKLLKELKLVNIEVLEAESPRQPDGRIQTVAVCAGSGGSVLKSCDVDLIVTGELGHHEQLAFLERGIHVILLGHAESERPFLPIMQEQIKELLISEGEQTEVLLTQADARNSRMYNAKDYMD